ncbi:DoxX family protein [Nonomuraea sp. 10N515B]|uniref:DoxX family protein n=1 Tax=Nonomuraea sp. 10N515B TaxID=3457422 RepID=UPI003FCCD2F5
MNIVLWVVSALLALVFLGAGGAKLAQSKEKLIASPNMAWAEDFPPGALKTIGALEVLGAIGLILPPALGIVAVLAPLAALGLAVTMMGAILTHARRKESQPVVINLVLLALALFVAWGRFGPYPFA